MNKYVGSVSKVSLAVLISSSLILTGCGKDEGEPGKLDTSQDEKQAKKKDDKKDNQSQHNKGTKYKEINKNKDANKAKEKANQHSKKLSIKDVASEIDVLHDFIVKDDRFYSDMQQKLAEKGITLEGDYSAPYIANSLPPDMDQKYLQAGIIVDKKVDQSPDSSAIVTYKVKSAMTDGLKGNGSAKDPNVAGAGIKDILKKDKEQPQEVKYKIELNKDKTKAKVTKLTKGDWTLQK